MSMKIKIFVLIIISAFAMYGFITPPNFLKSKEDRAKLYHYQALKLKQKGKEKLAIKKIKKALKLHRTNDYLMDLANLYARQGEKKKAYNTVSSISLKDSSPDLKKVELTAWKAYYALSIGLKLKPFEQFNKAIKLMELHKIDSTMLLSDLYNNSGVSSLFYQTATGKNQLPVIHYRDFERAKRKFKTALDFNPENCVASYNLDFVNTILEVPMDSMEVVKNVLTNHYSWRPFPAINCKLPEPPANVEIVEKLNKQKEVVFILDISGSMQAYATNGKTRFEAMKDLVLSLIEDLDPAVQIGLITLGRNDCGDAPYHSYKVGTLSRKQLTEVVNGLALDGRTPLNDRLRKATNLFTKKATDKAIFLCSDGINTCGRESTCLLGEEIAKKGIKIYAFSLLLETEDNENMQEYAIYDCITKATYGELLGITENKEYELKTDYITESVYPLVLKKEDLLNGSFEPLFPNGDLLSTLSGD